MQCHKTITPKLLGKTILIRNSYPIKYINKTFGQKTLKIIFKVAILTNKLQRTLKLNITKINFKNNNFCY